MTLSFFIGALYDGGAEKVVSMLANLYAEKGYDVDIILLLDGKYDRAHFNLNDSVNIVDLSCDGASYIKNSISWVRKIRSYVKQKSPDCIISFIGRINALVLTATIGLDVPTLISERNDPRNDGRGFLMRKYCDFIYRYASLIVYQTAYQKSCFSMRHKKELIIPNPIKDLPISEDKVIPYLITTAGRLVKSKNHIMLIEAISIAKKHIPKIQCHIYGDGVLYDHLNDKIKQLLANDYILLKGRVDNVPRFVGTSEIFVMTSEYEGLSNSLIEAMLLGKICISTDYPGVEEVIDDGINGVIVPRGDSEKLAEKLTTILLDIEQYRFLGINARRKMLNNISDNNLKLWDDAISSIINK